MLDLKITCYKLTIKVSSYLQEYIIFTKVLSKPKKVGKQYTSHSNNFLSPIHKELLLLLLLLCIASTLKSSFPLFQSLLLFSLLLYNSKKTLLFTWTSKITFAIIDNASNSFCLLVCGRH